MRPDPVNRMTTALDKPPRRELRIEEQPYPLAIDPDGPKRVENKGRRNGVALAWRDAINDDAALAGALQASVAPR